MRYLFRGLIRESGRPVEGHVEAASDEDAYSALSTNGVVTEGLTPDPKPLDLNQELPQSPEFADALESAFDSSSSQVEFDALANQYHGKKVWVIDRDKIRRRVAHVVDAALALSSQRGEAGQVARERVASAIQGLFDDNRNLASERNADSIAGIRFDGANGGNGATARRPGMPPPPPQPAAYTATGPATLAGSAALEQQIARMANMIKTAEATLATISAAARRVGSGGGGGGGPRRMAIQPSNRSEEQNSVLLEIFKSNLELVRSLAGPTDAAATVSEPAVPIEASVGADNSSVESAEYVAAETAPAAMVSESDTPLPSAERLD